MSVRAMLANDWEVFIFGLSHLLPEAPGTIYFAPLMHCGPIFRSRKKIAVQWTEQRTVPHSIPVKMFGGGRGCETSEKRWTRDFFLDNWNTSLLLACPVQKSFSIWPFSEATF